VEAKTNVVLGAPGTIGKNGFLYTVSIVDPRTVDFEEDGTKEVFYQLMNRAGMAILLTGLSQHSIIHCQMISL
jgi:hypothetical protein